jgi:hypothetical protein
MADNEQDHRHDDADAGGRAHTPEGRHPAGDGPRSDRDVGGPTAAPDAESTTGGTKGDIRTPRFEDDAHE